MKTGDEVRAQVERVRAGGAQKYHEKAREQAKLFCRERLDVLLDPERILDLLCQKLGIEFTRDMLHWPPGRRETDGVWAKYWYHAVERSTGFQAYRPKSDPVPDRLKDLHERCLQYHAVLSPHRLGGD